MRLRNKQTGEVADLSEGFIKDACNGEFIQVKPVAISNNGGYYLYPSLAALNEDWEDYKEPEGWWIICQKSNAYEPHATNSTLRNLDADREIGNYFESKEDAEEAVKKLEAWKRLKDKGFRFTELRAIVFGENVEIRGGSDTASMAEMWQDLELLFSGEYD